MKLLIFILVNCLLLVKCNNIIWSSCEAKCRNSAQLVTINASPIVPNGCGSYGFNIDFDKYGNIKGFNECCNQHDICYRTCNNTKVSCDKSFYSCLKTSCLDNDKYLVCLGLSKLMYESVENLGCIAYMKDVNNYCDCPF